MTKAKQISPDAAPLGTSRATPLPTLLSVNAVAIELSVCTKTVRRLIERDVLPCCRVGRLVRIRSADLEQFVTSGTEV
jgi:excisionase family DNA binding protein